MMFNNKRWMIFCALMYTAISHADVIEHNFPLKSTIDKNNFFSEQVTRFEFVPSVLALIYNKNTNTFDDVNTDLIVETDIPEANEDLSLDIRMTDSDMSCNDNDGNAITNSGDLSNVFLEDNQLEVEAPQALEFNDVIDGKKASKYNTRIQFESLPYGAVDCSGSVTMMLEFSL